MGDEVQPLSPAGVRLLASGAHRPGDSSPLPKGWSDASVLDVADLIRGVSYAKGETTATPDFGRIGLLRANNIGDGLNFDELQFVAKRRVSEEQMLRVGDVVIAMSSGSKSVVGKAGSVKQAWAGTFGAFCGVLRPRALLDAAFFGLFFQTRRYRSFISDASAGTNINNLKREYFASLQVPLPPLAEQRRIVAKVEEVLARVKAARKRLVKAPAILKRFRQSVLAAACSGRLTAEWRAQNSVVVDGADDLPASWRRRSLSELCEDFRYGTSQKSQKHGRVPVLRMGNIQDGRLDWSDLVFTDDEAEIRKYLLAPNTVLFNRTNSPELVGKTALYSGERPAIFAGYLIQIINGPELDPAFLNVSLNTPAFRDYCMEVKTDGVSQSNINAQKLAAYTLNWCPIAEQREIVRRVEAMTSQVDRVETRVAAAGARADTTVQSVLYKAFRGELV